MTKKSILILFLGILIVNEAQLVCAAKSHYTCSSSTLDYYELGPEDYDWYPHTYVYDQNPHNASIVPIEYKNNYTTYNKNMRK